MVVSRRYQGTATADFSVASQTKRRTSAAPAPPHDKRDSHDGQWLFGGSTDSAPRRETSLQTQTTNLVESTDYCDCYNSIMHICNGKDHQLVGPAPATASTGIGSTAASSSARIQQ
jgi:hypothetical protein